MTSQGLRMLGCRSEMEVSISDIVYQSNLLFSEGVPFSGMLLPKEIVKINRRVIRESQLPRRVTISSRENPIVLKTTKRGFISEEGLGNATLISSDTRPSLRPVGTS